MSPSNLPDMRISLVLRASILAVLLVGWMAAPAFAAPTVLSTDPEAGAEMHEPPAEVTVEFSEPLQSPSGMTVKDGCGDKVSEGKAQIVGPAMNELNVVIGEAPHHGTYTVEYVATGVTGTATGSFTFVVHGGTACDGTDGGGGSHDGDGGGGGHQSGGGHDGGGDDGTGGGGKHPDGHKGSGDKKDSSSGDHSDMDMSGHGEHQDMKHPKKKKHADMKHPNKKHGDMEHGDRKSNRTTGRGGGNAPIAGPPNLTTATDIPTGSTVLVALGLAVLMGLIGGWVLRVSGPS